MGTHDGVDAEARTNRGGARDVSTRRRRWRAASTEGVEGRECCERRCEEDGRGAGEAYVEASEGEGT